MANPESQLGVPLLVRGELLGVLCPESEMPYRFHEEDKASIELLGSYLAIAMQNMQLSERVAEAAEPAGASPGPGPVSGTREVVYYQEDETIFVDGEYLIRSLPARILWLRLSLHAASGRVT